MKDLITIFKTNNQAIEIEEIDVDALVQQIDECLNFRIFEIPTATQPAEKIQIEQKASQLEDAYFIVKIKRFVKSQN